MTGAASDPGSDETVPGKAGAAASVPLLAAAGAVLALAFALAVVVRPLSLPEEGRYVGVAWEMLRSGDWIVPTENGLPFFHKPPLFYWITAASMTLFGAHPAAARAAPLAGAAIGALALYWFVQRHAGRALARWSVRVLVTLPFFFAGAQFANLDMLVAGLMALAIVLAADAALAVRSGQPHRRVLVAAWAAAGLGVLAKGLIGIVLPGAVVIVWLLAMREPRLVLRLLSPLGILAFALVTLPWFALVQLRYPGFAHFFFVFQHFERFAAGGFNNVQPWWFFLAALPALTLPWSLWLLRARSRPAAAVETPGSVAVRRLMWTWLIAVVAFFSVPASKPVGYAMAVLFPLAVLVAEAVASGWLGGRPIVRRAVQASGAGALAICLAAVAITTSRHDRDHTALARTLADRRTAGDPVAFVGEYFFDVPVHAGLSEPVPVAGDWHDPKIAERDNWRRELAEGATFAPALAARLLVDEAHAFALACAGRPLWVLVKTEAEGRVAALPGAVRSAVSNGVALWRVGPTACREPALKMTP